MHPRLPSALRSVNATHQRTCAMKPLALTVLTLALAAPAAGQLTGELDVDVFGGQQPSTGGRNFPLVRLRRAFAVLERGRLTLFAGQEAPPIAEINPSSLARRR